MRLTAVVRHNAGWKADEGSTDKTTPQRVLFVDDNALVRTTLEIVLSVEGFAVRTCESAEEALEHLEAEHFDALVRTLGYS